MKNDVKGKAFVTFYKNFSSGFVEFQVSEDFFACCFYLGNEKSNSYCSNLSRAFERLQNTTLTGKTGTAKSAEHYCTRLVAVQLG